MKLWVQCRAVPVFLLLCGCPSTGAEYREPEPIHAEGTYVHEATGMAFPEAVDRFQRIALTRFDDKSRAVSVGYNLLTWGAPIVATVYLDQASIDVRIFPIPSIAGPNEANVAIEFDWAKEQILAAHPDATLITEGEVTVEQGGVAKSGPHAVFRFNQPFPYRDETVLSELYLLAHKKWFIRYRFTYLESYGEKGARYAWGLIEDLNWPR